MMKTLNKIQNEVDAIGKGYSCNFNHKGTESHFINGANTLCFSIIEHKVKFHSVGGSRFFYKDMSVDEFIKMMPSMLLTNDECDNIYRQIADKLVEIAQYNSFRNRVRRFS